MRRAFFRRPEGPALVVVDALRILGALSIIAAAVGWSPVPAAAVALAALGSLLPRALALRPSVDLAIVVVVLVAAWSSVLELYDRVPWVDIPIHFLLNGLMAALTLILLTRIGALPDVTAARRPRTAAVAMTTAIGFALGALWEFAEWAGHTFVDEAIIVGYDDTIGDMAAGGLGSVLAGLCLRWIGSSTVSADAARG